MLLDWLFSAGLPLCQRSMFLQDTNNPSNVNMSEGGRFMYSRNINVYRQSLQQEGIYITHTHTHTKYDRLDRDLGDLNIAGL